MAIKTFTAGSVLTASDTNTYLANAGLVYIGGGSVSAGTVLTADSVFTSTYENYRLVISQMQVSTAARAFRFNYRAGGVPNSAANYDYAYNGFRAAATADNTGAAGQTFAEIGTYIDTYANAKLGSCSIDIYTPQISSTTLATSNAAGYEGSQLFRTGGFLQSQTTVFDGFQINLSGSGTMSFNWRLYGYRQA